MNKNDIDEVIERAGLKEDVSVFNSAIEIDPWISGNELPDVTGCNDYDYVGYQILAALFVAVREILEE
jgi:hypothetical protein